MNSLAARFPRQFGSLQLSVLMLVTLLQRTPVLRLLVSADSLWLRTSLGHVLRSSTLVASALGVVDTLAGATTFTTNPGNPAAATVGTPFNAAFAVTGATGPTGSYTISGLPPGLSVPGSSAQGGNRLLNDQTGTISGTPTTAGSYVVSITAWQFAGGTGDSVPNTYTINVTGAAATAPAITSHPVNQSVTVGQSTAFTVTVTGTEPFTYQWRKNGNAIGGATSSSYSIGSSVLDDAGTYSVVVTNSAGSVTSNGATLTVAEPIVAPSITSHPSNQTVTVGQPASFSVSASGTAPFSYQWRKNGNDIGGATGSSYAIVSTTEVNGGTYSVVVTNSAGSATSNGATLTVEAAPSAPSITTHPASQGVAAGQPVTFSVAAAGTGPLTYQWRKNGNAIGGATSAAYTITSALAGDAGGYSVLVSNSFGSATSNDAMLTVVVAPSISSQPSNQSVTVGQSASFSVTTTGTAPFTYQWRKDGNPIGDATASTYTVGSAGLGDAGTYSVVVTNSAGSVTSDGATLAVVVPETIPVITLQPVGRSLTAGMSVAFSVAATGSANLTYQWRKGGVTIGGATASTFSIPVATGSDAGNYDVVVTNQLGSTASNAAVLSVVTLDINWSIVGSGDFNGDGYNDLVWENAQTGARGLQEMNHTTPIDWVDLPYFPLPWNMVGTGDFDGDGQTDILWENLSSGDRAIWLMNGVVPLYWVNLPMVPFPWHMVGTGDFDGDGQTDIIWENSESGDRALWIMNHGQPLLWVNQPTVPFPWRVAGTGDFDGDGQTDIIWENPVSGDRALWIMDGMFPVIWVNLPSVPFPWHIVGGGDFNNDGWADIIWENPNSADRALWLMHGIFPEFWINL